MKSLTHLKILTGNTTKLKGCSVIMENKEEKLISYFKGIDDFMDSQGVTKGTFEKRDEFLEWSNYAEDKCLAYSLECAKHILSEKGAFLMRAGIIDPITNSLLFINGRHYLQYDGNLTEWGGVKTKSFLENPQRIIDITDVIEEILTIAETYYAFCLYVNSGDYEIAANFISIALFGYSEAFTYFQPISTKITLNELKQELAIPTGGNIRQ